MSVDNREVTVIYEIVFDDSNKLLMMKNTKLKPLYK